jgi:hypothetical protein
MPDPAQGYPFEQPLSLLGMFVEVPVDRGLDGARGDVVYGDAVRGQLDRNSPHKHPDAPFGRAVGGIGRHGQILVYRGDVDDASPVALGDHLTGSLLAPEPHPRKVDRDHLLPHLQGRVEKGNLVFDASVVDHDVEATELLDGLLDQVPHTIRLGDVGLYGDSLAPALLYLLDRFLPFFGMAPVVDGYRGPFPSESSRDGPADPEGRARYRGDLIL